MGKKTNESRKALFDRLKMSGQLDVPVYGRRSKTKSAPKETEQFQWCCEVKHQGNLPSGFRRCIDCPLDSRPDAC